MKKAIFIWVAAGVLLTIIPFDLVAQKGKLVSQRVTLAEIPWSKSVSDRPGSGMRPGLDTVFVLGDGNEKELFSLVFKVPANTATVATVVSGYHYAADVLFALLLAVLVFVGTLRLL